MHAVDVDQRGDVVLSMSRVATPEQKPLIFNSAPAFKVKAIGDGGKEYTDESGFLGMFTPSVAYCTAVFRPKDPTLRPQTITVTIWPYNADPCADQSVVLRNIPLPAPQAAEGPRVATLEVHGRSPILRRPAVVAIALRGGESPTRPHFTYHLSPIYLPHSTHRRR